MDFWEILRSGVYFIIPLAVLLIAVVWIWWRRSYLIKKNLKGQDALMSRIRDYVIEGDLENAGQLCRLTDSPAARIIGRGVNRIGYSIREVSEAMAEIATIEKSDLGGGRSWLRVIAVISPMLGIIGTLLGITEIFFSMQDSAGVPDSVICNMISPSLITVICGFAVGIISLVALTCLDGLVEKGSTSLTSLCVKFLDLLNEPA